jgi:hypothetical protein
MEESSGQNESLLSYTISNSEGGLNNSQIIDNNNSNIYGILQEGHSQKVDDNTSEEFVEIEEGGDDASELERILSNSTIDDKKSILNEKPSLIPNESRFNAIEYLANSLKIALDSLEFDKALVIQSKMAGNLNNSTNEVLKTIEELKVALNDHIQRYELLKKEILPEIESNLRNGTKIVKKLTDYVKNEYPVEYSKGRSKVLENLTEDEEGLFS